MTTCLTAIVDAIKRGWRLEFLEHGDGPWPGFIIRGTKRCYGHRYRVSYKLQPGTERMDPYVASAIVHVTDDSGLHRNHMRFEVTRQQS